MNIGSSVMSKLVDIYEEGSIRNEDKLVFEAAQSVYKSSLEYMLIKIDFVKRYHK